MGEWSFYICTVIHKDQCYEVWSKVVPGPVQLAQCKKMLMEAVVGREEVHDRTSVTCLDDSIRLRRV